MQTIVTVVILFLLVIVGGLIAVLVTFVSADGAAREANAARTQTVEQLSGEYKLIHALAAGDVIVGVNEPGSSLFYKVGDEAHLWIPFHKIAGVVLTPVYDRWDETTATTRTSRGGQLVGAGLGMAVAGPIGALIGGTTASQHTTGTSRSSETLRALELEIRLRDMHRPRLILSISERLPSGATVPPGLEARSKDLAALLATVVQDQPREPAVAEDPEAASIAWPSPAPVVNNQRGWWRRTFGG